MGTPISVAERIARVGIALTSIHDLDTLLELIVSEARSLAQCDGGTVFLCADGSLHPVVWQNGTLGQSRVVGERVIGSGKSMPVSANSLAGWVASTHRIANVPDAYTLPDDAPFELDTSWDRETGYRTTSVLGVPMLDADGSIVGVLQLINAMENGRVTPFSREAETPIRAIASQAAVAIQNARLHDRLKQSYFDTIVRLSMAAEYRDPDTARHLEQMSRYSHAVALGLGLTKERAEMLRFAAPMHDIGKLGVPDAILLKPGPLTPEERLEMQEHTTIGARILAGSDADIIRLSATVALTHHERWDGAGYPAGLSGESIPIEGRIVALADAFDCISSRRVYKEATPFEESVRRAAADRGTHFDPACVDAFLTVVPEIAEVYATFMRRSADSHDPVLP